MASFYSVAAAVPITRERTEKCTSFCRQTASVRNIQAWAEQPLCYCVSSGGGVIITWCHHHVVSSPLGRSVVMDRQSIVPFLQDLYILFVSIHALTFSVHIAILSCTIPCYISRSIPSFLMMCNKIACVLTNF